MIYQLNISLRRIKPTIWRQLIAAADTPLDRLHTIFQIAMGWEDCHLHEFDAGGRRYGVPDQQWTGERFSKFLNEKGHTLQDIAAGEGSRFVYTYDFGDDWQHDVLVQTVRKPESGDRFPRCLAGERACPPEDSGGAPGYSELLEALNDPKHDRHEELTEWIGGSFDPEDFDLGRINRQLARLRAPGTLTKKPGVGSGR